MSSDRRQHERFELLAHVGLQRGGHVETFVTLNISAGGVLLQNQRRVSLAIGERIHISFDALDLAPAFGIDAMIVRVVVPATKAPLIGAMWTSSDATATAALGQLLWNLRNC